MTLREKIESLELSKNTLIGIDYENGSMVVDETSVNRLMNSNNEKIINSSVLNVIKGENMWHNMVGESVEYIFIIER